MPLFDPGANPAEGETFLKGRGVVVRKYDLSDESAGKDALIEAYSRLFHPVPWMVVADKCGGNGRAFLAAFEHARKRIKSKPVNRAWAFLAAMRAGYDAAICLAILKGLRTSRPFRNGEYMNGMLRDAAGIHDDGERAVAYATSLLEKEALNKFVGKPKAVRRTRVLRG